MPIRINLLADAQALEELRRRDPVKRGIWLGSFVVILAALWAVELQIDIFFQNKKLQTDEMKWRNTEPRFKSVTDNNARVGLTEDKLAALDRMATNRFLWGNVLNSLQQTVVDQIQITRIRSEQTYTFTEAVAEKEVDGRVIPRKPAAMTERISLTVEGRDRNPTEQNYAKYKEALSSFGFFLTNLQRQDGFVLETLSAPTLDPTEPTRQFVSFSLGCHFPEVERHE